MAMAAVTPGVDYGSAIRRFRVFPEHFAATMFGLRRRSVRVLGIRSRVLNIRIDATVAIEASLLMGHEGGDLGESVHRFLSLRFREWADQ